ncbi:MAG: helix-hairpin-helix domain-containing protein [Gammaproteobacteria bacterium]
MANTIRTQTLDKRPVEFVDEIIGAGGMKDVYFSPDRSYVVGFFRDRQDYQAKDRLTMIAGRYRDGIFNQAGGEYWKDLYCWPTGVVELNGKLGVVAPAYQKHFFFEYGSKNQDFLGIKGREKEGKWFASANNQNRFLDARERGDWLNYVKICIRISRAVRRMHAAGLAHSDLSYKNVLVDPVRGNACVIDIDGLVVPGKFPPDVVGTPDFIAPEVVMTGHLKKDDPARVLPSIATDRHALAILIYMYLLYRHPLRGDKVHAEDPQIDETLSMGAKALFVEHPSDAGNRIRIPNKKPSELPWADTTKIPYTVTGPYLAALFNRAFMDGLHDPAQRPTADDWEQALVKTVDLVQPCRNPDCAQKWYIFDNTLAPKCPFCGTAYKGKLPVLNLYSARRAGRFKPENHRVMVYTNQSLFPWHMNRNVFPNERLTPDQKKRIGYFVFHADAWWLVNERMPDLTDVTTNTPIPVGSNVELTDGQQLLLSKEDGGRLVMVQMVDGR